MKSCPVLVEKGRHLPEEPVGHEITGVFCRHEISDKAEICKAHEVLNEFMRLVVVQPNGTAWIWRSRTERNEGR